LTDINKALPDIPQPAKKKHAFKAPIRKIDNIFVFSGRMGQHISKIIVGNQIRIDPAEFADKQAVCLF
jgi:hypothetical protein